MQSSVFGLLGDAGVDIRVGERSYRPRLSLPGFDAKLLKARNVVEMLHAGSRDVGFAGADWVAELDADLPELLDTGLDPVRVAASAPEALLDEAGTVRRAGRTLVVASEYARLTRQWLKGQTFDARFVRSYGATEAFPPEDADLIVDNVATGATLRENGLAIVDTIMRSSTRLYASQAAMADPARSRTIRDLVLLVESALEARSRVMLELNVSSEDLGRVVPALPCMREPTVSQLHGGTGYAVRVAVPRQGLPELLIEVKALGATDLVVSQPRQIVR